MEPISLSYNDIERFRLSGIASLPRLRLDHVGRRSRRAATSAFRGVRVQRPEAGAFGTRRSCLLPPPEYALILRSPPKRQLVWM